MPNRIDPDEEAKRVLLEALRKGTISRDQLSPDVLAKLEGEKRESPGLLESITSFPRVVKQGLLGAAEVPSVLGEGLANIFGDEKGAAEAQGITDRIRSISTPDQPGEGGARMVGRIAGEAGLGGAAGLPLKALGLGARGAVLAGEAATGVGISQAGADESILGGVAEMTGSESMKKAAENPLLRALTEVGVIAGIGVAGKGVSRMRGAREAAARELDHPDALILAKGRGVLLRDAASVPEREVAEAAFSAGKGQAVFPGAGGGSGLAGKIGDFAAFMNSPRARGDWFRAQYLKWTDIDKPYEWASVPGLLPEDDPAILSRVGRRAASNYASRVWDEGLSKVGLDEMPYTPSPRIAVEEYARGDAQGLGYAMIAKREAELRGRGLGKRLTDEQLEAGENLFKRDAGINNAVAAFKEYWDGWLNLLEEEGVLSAGAFKRIKDAGNFWFTPLRRVQEEAAHIKRDFGVVRSDDPLGKLRMVGDDAKTIYENPVLSSITQTFEMSNVIHIKRVHTALAKIGREGLNEDMIRPLKELPSDAEELSNFGKVFDDLGIDIESDKLYKLGEDEYAFSFLNREGKRELFSIDKFLYDAMRTKEMAPLEGVEALLEKMITTPGKSLRLGVTLTPAFGAANLFRDSLFRAVTEKNLKMGPEALGEIMTGGMRAMDDLINSALKNTPAGREIKSVRVFEMSGGSMSTLADMDTNKLRGVISNMNRESSAHTMSMLNVRRKLGNVIRGARTTGAVSENVTRKAAFDKAVADALAQGMDEKNANLLGAYAAGEASVDFSRRGSHFEEKRLVHTLDKGTAFWRATIQSMDRVARVFGDIDRVGAHFDTKAIARLGVTAGATLTVPALVNYSYNRQNPDDYFNISKDLRSRYVLFDVGKANGWLERLLSDEIGGEDEDGKSILKSGNSLYMKIPMPHELGWFFGTIPIRMLEEIDPANPQAKDDPLVQRFDAALEEALGTIGSSVGGMFAPFNPLGSGFGGTGISTALQVIGNKDVFRDVPIEDPFEREQLRGGPTELVSQIGADKASLGAKGITEALNPVLGAFGKPISPAQVDFAARGIGGGAGSFLLGAPDLANRAVGDPIDMAANEEAQKRTEIPLARRFFVDPRGKGEAGNAFYDEYFKLRSQVEGSRVLEDKGKIRDAARVIPENKDVLRYNLMKVIYDRLASLSEAERMTRENQAIDPETKRAINDKIREESRLLLRGATYRPEEAKRILEQDEDPERRVLIDNYLKAIAEEKAAKAKLRSSVKPEGL